MISFLYLIFLLSSPTCYSLTPAASTHHRRPNTKKINNIFILAGQSNMSGRGGVINGTWNGIIPPQCRPNPSVLRFTRTLYWVEAEEPLNRDIDLNKTCGISPGLSFANSLLPSLSEGSVIGLVPCAVGGTSICQWSRGTFLYNRLLNRTTAALLKNRGSLKAILWYQGESDTVNLDDAELYKNRLVKFLTDVRHDLNSSMLPVIQVGLASGEGSYVEVVRSAQMGIKLPGVKFIDGKGLELEPDNLHLTAQSEVKLGEMFADAFLQHRTRPK